MSEKHQRTAASLREKMLSRYGETAHKHNKCHLSYRLHFKSHPCKSHEEKLIESDEILSNGILREFKLRKVRKRLDKGQIH